MFDSGVTVIGLPDIALPFISAHETVGVMVPPVVFHKNEPSLAAVAPSEGIVAPAPLAPLIMKPYLNGLTQYAISSALLVPPVLSRIIFPLLSYVTNKISLNPPVSPLKFPQAATVLPLTAIP